jgi:hypothetical protein
MGHAPWYATQPTVTKLADDRAEQFKRDPDKLAAELDARLRADLKRNGDFSRIHPLPRSGADVPDDYDARLVVLPSEHSYSKGADSPAEVAAKAILESRGNAPPSISKHARVSGCRPRPAPGFGRSPS